MESAQDVDRHNTRELWRDAARQFTVAREELENALGTLEDLGETVLLDGRVRAMIAVACHCEAVAKGHADA